MYLFVTVADEKTSRGRPLRHFSHKDLARRLRGCHNPSMADNTEIDDGIELAMEIAHARAAVVRAREALRVCDATLARLEATWQGRYNAPATSPAEVATSNVTSPIRDVRVSRGTATIAQRIHAMLASRLNHPCSIEEIATAVNASETTVRGTLARMVADQTSGVVRLNRGSFALME